MERSVFMLTHSTRVPIPGLGTVDGTCVLGTEGGILSVRINTPKV